MGFILNEACMKCQALFSEEKNWGKKRNINLLSIDFTQGGLMVNPLKTGDP